MNSPATKPVTKGQLDETITRSFRNVADTDYIAARICWRCHLDHQFFWMALQAVEKYLKAILLFHRTSAKGLGHDICKSLERVKKLSAIDLDLSEATERFIQILNFKGPNRYFEWNLNRQGNELLQLDETVWKLRIYCVPLKSDIKVFNESDTPKVIWTTEEHFANIKKCGLGTNPNSLAIPYGQLEEILTSEIQSAAWKDAREQLVWKNLYFGRKQKRSIQWRASGHYSSPQYVIEPEIFTELEKFVDFSFSTREYFQTQGGKQFPKIPPGFFQLRRTPTRKAD